MCIFSFSIQVNVNGLISFRSSVLGYNSKSFPLSNGENYVSPFWTDIDIRQPLGGKVCYISSTQTGILQKVTDDVKRAFVSMSHFQAIWMIIVTWENVTFYRPPRTNIETPVSATHLLQPERIT